MLHDNFVQCVVNGIWVLDTLSVYIYCEHELT